MRKTATSLATVAVGGALALAPAGTATAEPVLQEGLVNVNVTDVTVQVPIALAANLCDINVNVLAEQVRGGDTECDARASSDAVFVPNSGDTPVEQRGLVNVNVDDVVVQLPVAIAANVCDVNVNVLARQLRQGGATCPAEADPEADT